MRFPDAIYNCANGWKRDGHRSWHFHCYLFPGESKFLQIRQDFANVGLKTLGGALIVSVCQSIYVNIFKKHIEALTIPGLDQARIIASGATGFRRFVPASVLEPVVHAAMFSIRRAFIPACVYMGLVMIATIPLPYASIKGATAAGGA